MSPRSEEFVEQARDRLQMAREVLAAGHRAGAVSTAYYSMLYAARATLSEDEENARTHRGTWNLFRIRYVTTDAFDAELFTVAQHAQVAREGGDYQAVTPSEDEARRCVDAAGRFLEAVEAMLGASAVSGNVRPLWLALVAPGGVLDRSTWRCHAFGSASLPGTTMPTPEPGERHRTRH